MLSPILGISAFNKFRPISSLGSLDPLLSLRFPYLTFFFMISSLFPKSFRDIWLNKRISSSCFF